MKIDLHVHSKNCSDGRMSIEEIFLEAKRRNIGMLSITDHDSLECQVLARAEAEKNNIRYITGVELNITFSHPELTEGKDISLDFLAYNCDVENTALTSKLKIMSDYREERALKILEKINVEFESEGIEKFTEDDIKAIQAGVDGVFARPHIANYLVEKGIVTSKQEAFDKYLVKCDVPKYPFKIEEASKLVKNAGGIGVLAHPNDPNGTSLVKLTTSLEKQTDIIEKAVLPYLNGIECWHSRHTPKTSEHYMKFTQKHNLIMTGGSDCHQNPVIMGTVDVPERIAAQFDELIK
ncbi:MAG: PHP domain-containing protein [Thermoplasmata archaeon]|nr:MAG: PHP domain-containing protein [Thermoplasmata archaeon]